MDKPIIIYNFKVHSKKFHFVHQKYISFKATAKILFKNKTKEFDHSEGKTTLFLLYFFAFIYFPKENANEIKLLAHRNLDASFLQPCYFFS